MKYIVLLLLCAAMTRAEDHSFSLRQALEIASRQNPDIMLARLDEQRAKQNVAVTRNPFSPKVYAGSGAAYVYGYPNSIDGNAPSIFSLKTDMALFNKPESYLVAAARENARGTQLDAQERADEVAYRTASLYLDAEEAARQRSMLETQMPSLRQAIEVMQSRVAEGSELPVENQRAKVNLNQAQHELNTYRANEDYAETLLAVTLGYSANDRVKPAGSNQSFDVPADRSEDDSVQFALQKSKDLKRLQSAVLSKELEMRSYRTSRLPQVSLVAQYSLLAKYAYTQYFPAGTFQYNNLEIGASFVVPVLVGSAAGGQVQEAATDLAKLRIQINQTRNKIISDTRKSYQDMKDAQETRDLARQQLDLAHQDLSGLLAHYAEGQAKLTDVERARTGENERWLAMYQAEAQFERSKLAVLRQLGDLMAALRTSSNEPEKQP